MLEHVWSDMLGIQWEGCRIRGNGIPQADKLESRTPNSGGHRKCFDGCLLDVFRRPFTGRTDFAFGR